MAAETDRLDGIEAALLDAVANEDAGQIEALASERDGLIRGLAPTLDARGLRALAERDRQFGARMIEIRDRVLAELDALRAGRRATRAYAETART